MTVKSDLREEVKDIITLGNYYNDDTLCKLLTLIKRKVGGLRMEKKKLTDWTKTEHYKICPDGCQMCIREQGKEIGRNQAVSEINKKISNMEAEL